MKLVIAGALVAVIGLVAGGVARTLSVDEIPAGVLDVASVHDCPTGSIVAEYSSGSRVFAVARTESSTWVQVRDLAAPDHTVWVSASDVDLDSDISTLPVGECNDGGGVVAVSGDSTTTTVPGTTTTVPPDTTTTVPGTTTTDPPASTTTTDPPASTTTTLPETTTTDPPASTTTTEAPDTTPPVIQQPSVAPGEIWEEDTSSLSCPSNTPRQSEISALVSDDVGVASVRATWTIGGTPGAATLVLSQGVYTMTFGPYEYLTIPDSKIQDVAITITARDAAGNSSSVDVQVTVQSLARCFG